MSALETMNYRVQNDKISNLINWIGEGKIGLPELQRPFVWKSSKVRDFIDSLYRGYPVGYIITWNNPDVRLKDGTTAQGKTLMIDGQQRVTALRAAIAGEKSNEQTFRNATNQNCVQSTKRSLCDSNCCHCQRSNLD